MGSKVYNKLPNYIKDVDSYTDFKKESGTPHNRDSNLSLTVTCVAVVSFPYSFPYSVHPRLRVFYETRTMQHASCSSCLNSRNLCESNVAFFFLRH